MKVRIYKSSKNTMQSGLGRTKFWVLETEAETPRVPEPLMGWTSSGDTLNQIRIRFETLDQAIRHASEKGWDYSVLPPQERRVRPRNYADNFRYIPPKDSAKT